MGITMEQISTTVQQAAAPARARATFDGMPPGAFELLEGLAADNTRDWMRAYRASVLDDLTGPFTRYLVETTRRLRDEGFALKGGAKTVFRMQRDLRFARKDRRPFHEHLDAVFSRDGRRHRTRASIHVRFDVSGGFLRAGSFFQPASGLKALRESMVAREQRFLGIARDLADSGCPLKAERSLKRSPRGFEDVVGGDLVAFLKGIDPVAERSIGRDAWASAAIVDQTLDFAQATRSWRLFLAEAQGL